MMIVSEGYGNPTPVMGTAPAAPASPPEAVTARLLSSAVMSLVEFCRDEIIHQRSGTHLCIVNSFFYTPQGW